MPPIVIAIAATAAAYGATAAVTGAVIAGFAISAAAATAIGALAGAFTSIALSSLIGSGKGSPLRLDPLSNNQGIQQLVRGSAETQRIIYGRQRSSGVVAFIGTSDKGTEQNKYLHLAIALAGHEIDAIENIFINDTEVGIVNNEAVGAPWSEVGTRIFTGGDGLYTPIVLPAFNLSARLDFFRLTINGAGQTDSTPNFAANILVGNPLFDSVSYPYTINFTLPAETIVLIGADQYKTIQDVVIPYTFRSREGIESNIFLTLPLDKNLVSSPANGMEVFFYRKGNNLVFCRKYLGTDNQTAEPELIKAFPSRWTLAHQLRGTAYLYLRLEYNGTVFPNGLPNVQAIVRGRKVYDPRTGATAYSNNSALCMRDYLVSDFGFDAPGKVNEQSFIAAANICDEDVSLSAGGTEKRYTCNTIIDTSSSLNDAANQMLSSMSGLLSYSQGGFIIAAGAYETPSITIDESWMAGGISLQTKIPRRELFNGVKGVFVDPNNNWQKVSYPVQESATLQVEDGADIIRDIDYPSTTSAATCQRLARIALLKSRQSIRATLICNFKAMQLRPLLIVGVTNENLGWSNKPFRIITWRYAADGKGIEVDVEEEASENYDWNTSLEQTVDAAPNTLLPDAFTVNPPGIPVITEQLALDTGGVLSNTVNMNWTASSSAFVSGYLVEYKLYNQPDWIETGTASGTAAQIRSLSTGAYDFRITAINQLGQRSKPAQTVYTVTGDTAPPADIEDFFITEIGSQAHLSWKQVTDLDVKYGGRIRLRFSQATPGTWSEAFDINGALPGVSTGAVVPLLSGTYLIKAVDSSGRESVNAAVITTNVANILNLNVVATSQQSAAFTGTKTGFVVSGGELILDGTSLFDSAAGLFDGPSGIFDGAGTSTLVSSAEYLFNTYTDLGAVYTSRVTADMQVRVENTANLFDAFQGNFDASPGRFDGEDLSGIEASLYVRTTNDNPAGSPTWSSWRKFFVGDYTCRAYEFKLNAESNNNSLNIAISALAVQVDVPDRLEQDKDVAIPSGGRTFTFAKPFFIAPAIAASVQNAATGDYAAITAKSLTGFTIRVYNSGGAGVERTIDWIARAY